MRYGLPHVEEGEGQVDFGRQEPGKVHEGIGAIDDQGHVYVGKELCGEVWTGANGEIQCACIYCFDAVSPLNATGTLGDTVRMTCRATVG